MNSQNNELKLSMHVILFFFFLAHAVKGFGVENAGKD